jgi:hypothetical protein
LAEWDLRVTPQFQTELEEDGETMSKETVSPHALVHLDRDLSNLRKDIDTYYNYYAGQGCIQEELAVRASGGDWEHVKER